ncbi:MAG: efflux RND transporter permease subunit, partial [Desulfurivibrionaceae bacterium]
MRLFRRGFDYLLRLALSFRFTTMFLLLAAFAAAMIIAISSLSGKSNLIKIEFFPDDYSLYYVEVSGPVGTPLEKTSEVLKRISRLIAAEGPGMAESTAAFAGYYINEDFQPVWGNHLGHVAVNLPARKARQFADYPENDVVAHLDWVRQHLARELPDSEGYSLRIRPEKDGPPEGKDVNIRVLGADLEGVGELAAEIKNYLESDPVLSGELIDLDDNQGRPGRIFRYVIKDDRAAEYGLSKARVANLAAAVINGRNIGQYRLSDEDIDIKLKIDPSHIQELSDTLSIVVLEHPSGPVRLGDICAVETYLEPGYLNRFQGQRAITLTANLRSGATHSSTGIVNLVKNHYNTVRDDFAGATLNFAEEFESTRNSFISLTYAFLIAIMLIYLI